MELTNKPTSPQAWSERGDTELLSAVAGGCTEAFKALYMRHFSRMEQFVIRMTRRTDLVEEIINDTFFTVWQKAAGFNADSRVSTWIYGICYRKSLKAMERSERWRARHASDTDYELLPSDGRRPEEEAGQAQLNRRLREELNALPAEQRTVLELTYFMGYSCPEIAEVIDCPVNTIKTRMFHARQKLRKTLAGQAGT